MHDHARGPITALAITAVIATWAVGHQVVASAVHADLWPAWSAADSRYDEAAADYDATAERGESAIRRGEALAEAASGDLVDPADLALLSEELEHARARLADEPASPGIAGLGDPDGFAPAWERYADAWRIVGLVPSRTVAAESLDVATHRVAEGNLAIADASEALVAGTEALATAALEDNPAATHRTRVAVQQAIDDLRHSPTISSGSADPFADLATAVAAMRSSQASEAARRADHPERARIEDFAESIANGVPFDVEWADEAGGYSSSEYYAGTAEFFPDGAGWGLITLTYSIEDAYSWDENAEAVVVHEVGHIQVLREECAPIFSGSVFSSDHEMWATAWAISMGYDIPGSGIEAYGRPSDAQIDAAAGCR
ncbi:hypothetical protein [Agromyces marinus]|uniref:Uncharacterized protein n=1 Tax=Agromyces marinus TaxID=1389020 RepID=A0ABN6YCT0_9MICO|nr:hypothetical protein [Agromyces marinus]UIP57977.1 hypothetical protein DSM26151_08460 [Agromyces marinus]BDZ53821.1 hypothetical protein GCM10025870_08940 [Agromyces marinus]